MTRIIPGRLPPRGNGPVPAAGYLIQTPLCQIQLFRLAADLPLDLRDGEVPRPQGLTPVVRWPRTSPGMGCSVISTFSILPANGNGAFQ